MIRRSVLKSQNASLRKALAEARAALAQLCHPQSNKKNRRVFRVRVADCRFTLESLSAQHLFPGPHTVSEEGPISVSRLNDNSLFVHNGRHRVIRALLNEIEWLDAVSEYDDDGTSPPSECESRA